MKTIRKLTTIKEKVEAVNKKSRELMVDELVQVNGGLITKEKIDGYYCEKCGMWHSSYERALEHEQNCQGNSDGTAVLFSRTVEVD